MNNSFQEKKTSHLWKKQYKAQKCCLKRSEFISTFSADESICAFRASEVSPRDQHQAWKAVFFSQWFHPHRLSSCILPEEKCLLTAVLSCPLSATIAIMKMGLAMRGSRETWPSLQSLSARSSGRRAGLPPGRLLEEGRQRQHISTTYLHQDVILDVLGLF